MAVFQYEVSLWNTAAENEKNADIILMKLDCFLTTAPTDIYSDFT